MPERRPLCVLARTALAASALPADALAAAVESPISAERLTQLGGGLLVVLVLIALSAVAVRRFLRIEPSGSGPLRIVAGLAMGPREKLLLVEAGGERILLGVAPGRVCALHVLAPHPDTGGEAEGEGALADRPRDFRALLGALHTGGRRATGQDDG